MLADVTDGGNCTGDADLACIDASVGYKYTPSAEDVGKSLYLSCSVGDHCPNGQTVVVHVTRAPEEGVARNGASPPPPPAADVAGSCPSGGVGALQLFAGLLIGAGLTVCAGYFVIGGKKQSANPVVNTISMTSPPTKPGLSDDPAHVRDERV